MGVNVPSSLLMSTLCLDEKSMDLTGVHLSQFLVHPAAGQLCSAGLGWAGGGPETWAIRPAAGIAMARMATDFRVASRNWFVLCFCIFSISLLFRWDG